MAQKADERIKEALWKLLQDRPLNKITVKDIVTQCGINRNTFYYHFESIPALAEELTEELIDNNLKKYATIESFEECLDVAVNFITENKKAVYHIYNSVDRSAFEDSLLKVCHYAVATYINRAFKNSNLDTSIKKQLITYFKCALFGQILDWLQGGLKIDGDQRFKTFCDFNKVIIDSFLNGCTF